MSEEVFQVTVNGARYSSPEDAMRTLGNNLLQGVAMSATALSGTTRTWLEDVVKKLADKHGNSWPGGTTGGALSRRSGDMLSQLREGIEVMRAGSVDQVSGSLKGNEYTAIQEFGGTLRASGAKYLAIPLPAALRNDGTPVNDNPRDWKNTFVQMSKRGNLLIFQKRGDNIIPLYALKTSVTLPPRLGALRTAQESMPYFTEKALDAVLSSFKF